MTSAPRKKTPNDATAFEREQLRFFLARDDLAVSANALGVALSVFVFYINSRCKCPDRVAIDRTQLLIQSSIFFGTLRDLFEQTMRVNANAYVPHHRPDGLEIIV